jgi:hypothetical protein
MYNCLLFVYIAMCTVYAQMFDRRPQLTGWKHLLLHDTLYTVVYTFLITFIHANLSCSRMELLLKSCWDKFD